MSANHNAMNEQTTKLYKITKIQHTNKGIYGYSNKYKIWMKHDEDGHGLSGWFPLGTKKPAALI